MSLLSLRRSPQYRRAFGVLAVLSLALWALIPTGFMIATVDGHARLVMCPAGLHQSAHAHHMAGALHQSTGMNHAGLVAHAAAHCPFALAGGPGLIGAGPEPARPFLVMLRPVRTAAFASVATAPPPRHQAPRGPPALV